VVSMGDHAFYGCTGLTSITIGDGVTSIGHSAFYGCTGLATARIGDGVMRIGEDAFGYCTSLTTVTIPDSVTSIDGFAFYYCTSLNRVNISDIGAWCEIEFCYSSSNPLCYGADLYLNGVLVENLVVPDGVTCISENAFYGCTSLTSITIPDSVTSIGEWAFYNCANLTTVTIFDGMTSIGRNAFDNCTGLTTVTIPDSVISIGDLAFYDCSSLTDVTIPDRLTSIGYGMFWGCSSLTSVTIPDSVTSIDKYAFSDCYSLSQVYISDIGAWCEIAFDAYSSNPLSNGADLYLNGVLVENLVIPDGVTSIGHWAFFNCSGLTTVTIPDSVTEIGDEAFYSCERLYLVVLGSGVKYIGEEAFDDCYNLFHVLFRGTEAQWDAIRLRESGYHCQAMGNEVTLHETCCGHYVYCDICRQKVGYLPGGGKGHSFAGGICTACGVPEYLYYDINTSTCEVVIWGFDGSVSSVEIPDTIEQLSVVGIEYLAFSNQNGLINVIIGDNVETIGWRAFAGCQNLVNVSFGSGITTIYEGAFYECPKLNHVLFDGTATQWNQIAVDPDNLTILNATIHYNASADAVCWKHTGGIDYLYCTICETVLMEECKHSQTELRAAVAATCTEPGYSGDTYCIDCGEKLAEGEAIAPLGHNYEDGICTNCGEEDPNALPENPFTDVKEGDYYFTPILWAVENGITNGTSATEFSPEAPCTRGQIVTFLWRAFGSPEPTSTENPFTDVPENMYYYKAILWAVEQGITTGTSATTFSPEATCTRGQVATFLWRACGKLAPQGSENPFTDVPETVYYYEPILWAVENGITNGTGNGKFSPEDSCTRGQIVTFLYRALAE